MKLKWYDYIMAVFRMIYLLLRYGIKGAEKKVNNHLIELGEDLSVQREKVRILMQRYNL